MYVVRRSFKNFGEVMLPGSVVEPGSIKMFKTRLKDHVIVEVPAQDFDKWNEYFKNKYGVEIQVPCKADEDASIETEETSDEATKSAPDETKTEEPKTVVKPVARVVVTAKN